MGEFLALCDVSKSYGAVRAVHNVSLEIRRGELVTFLGPSGSGKTTVLMTIAGFVQSDSGDILLDGTSIMSLPPYKRNIGVVFQQYALFPHMSVASNIAYSLKIRRMPTKDQRRAVDKVLDLVQLSQLAQRRPTELSGGQQQRVALARALVFRPQILLMDEPLGALDRKLRFEMQLEVRRIQQHLGITTVYVTHDQEEALTISDRIAVMQNGKVIELGTPMDMYERPQTAFVADFLGEANVLHGQVLKVDNELLTITTNKGLRMTTVACGKFVAGDRVAVALRPERFFMGKADNSYKGVVRHVVYLGGILRMEIGIGDESLVITINRHTLAEVPNAGDEIDVGWDAKAPIVICPSG